MTEGRRARRSPASPRVLEAGVAPTEQNEGPATSEPIPFPSGQGAGGDEPPTEVAAPAEEPTPEPKPKEFQAALSGPELQEIRRRNDATDKAAADAQQAGLVALYAQEALTGFIAQLIRKYDLDPEFIYKVDVDRAAIVPAQRRGG